ncbi:HAD hydrolase family protein [Lentisphaerota bacterium ZTH]|nr:HAD hydrolase family protein [Lentisphaerota bacterium]WET06747.1 HAD hydrolase family protein [Lentisphaerota bacterium ZTH]
MISQDKIDRIKALVLDIDGVLTDGRMGYSDGEEVKFFHVRDGHGIKLAIRAGLKVGAFSGRQAEANRKRAAELGFSFLYENQKNKREAFQTLLQDNDLLAEECLYIGDDVVDGPVMRQCGIAVTVADAPDYMDQFSDFRTVKSGGHGAVREVIDWLLQKQGKWEQQMERYVS